MDAYDRFHKLLARDFAPLLRSEGFKGSGTTFRRLNGEAIRVVNIQGSQGGGRCYVNLGFHFSFLPSPGGGSIKDTKKIKEYQCEFRERLHEADQSDHWWSYGETESESAANAANLVDTYRRRGALFFERFQPFPGVFEQITPGDIDAGDLTKLPSEMNRLSALLMANVMNHLGRADRRRAFAEVGLRHLGRATGLKAELERLRDLQ